MAKITIIRTVVTTRIGRSLRPPKQRRYTRRPIRIGGNAELSLTHSFTFPAKSQITSPLLKVCVRLCVQLSFCSAGNRNTATHHQKHLTRLYRRNRKNYTRYHSCANGTGNHCSNLRSVSFNVARYRLPLRVTNQISPDRLAAVDRLAKRNHNPRCSHSL